MSWIRRLLPVIRTSLLFGLVGMPLGAIVFLGGFGILAGKPLMAFRILGDPGIAAWLTAYFGGIPAIATGAAAAFLRGRFRSFLTFALAMTIVGAVVTAIYLLIVVIATGGLRWWPNVLILVGGIAATGGVASVSCAFLLWRSARPAPR